MLYLGIDAGATKTKAVLLSEDKQELVATETPGANASVIGISNALKNIESAVSNISRHIRQEEVSACFAISGVDSQKSLELWQKTISSSSLLNGLVKGKILVVNDTKAAIRSATTAEDAIVIIAGTGSNCWGRNSQGQEAKAGGVGHILSDEGSAYDIGLKILKSVTQQLDNRGPKTTLTDMLFSMLGINSLEELIDQVYKKPWQKTDIAEIAPLVDKAATLGDKSAAGIIEKATIDITKMVKTVAAKLNLTNKNYDLVTTGSVFNIKKLFKTEVQKKVQEFSPNVHFPDQKFNSATAAAHLATELSG